MSAKSPLPAGHAADRGGGGVKAANCKDCLQPLDQDKFEATYGQCHECNGAEVREILLSTLRKKWHDEPENRCYTEAWAKWVQEKLK